MEDENAYRRLAALQIWLHVHGSVNAYHRGFSRYMRPLTYPEIYRHSLEPTLRPWTYHQIAWPVFPPYLLRSLSHTFCTRYLVWPIHSGRARISSHDPNRDTASQIYDACPSLLDSSRLSVLFPFSSSS
ncbi:hypothetical protein RSAG8_06266, partial [Rhizoctonia solani AG-8 WAC10335]